MPVSSALPPLPRGRRQEALDRPVASRLALPASHVAVIEQSHDRCAAYGLTRIERPDYAPLGCADLAVARGRNERLFTHAAPVMEVLHDQIAGTESMVVLCDATGTVIHSVGDEDFLGKASKVALQPGVDWSEQAKGTNAIGTALIEERATLVHADEHFLHANHFLTCSAVPILDPRGNLLGVLDVSGDQRSYHQHTMALVKMSARMIENQWLGDTFRTAMRLHFHLRPEFIGTLVEGILAVSPEGRIIGANRSALEQLGLSGAALRMHSLASLFGTSVGVLVDRFRSPLATPVPVHLAGGGQFYVQARFDGPIWGGAVAPSAAADAGSAATATAAPAAAAAKPGIGLSQLDTGDAQIAAVVGKVRRVLDRDIPILVLGETGTGKELLARGIHHDSRRAQQPFVAVNCASIPETLIEAELFGYEEGAFTGARRKGSAGKILQASGGTLFLDEIGDMPLPLQAHLLRVLQERCVTPLGSTRSIPVDVAIICATHRNLREMVDSRAFREDLYYRLNGLAVRMPPLRERGDLDTLVRRILDDDPASCHLRLAAPTSALFRAYRWPGNVRQLRNVLRTASVMAGGEPLITPAHLPDDFLDEVRQLDGALAADPPPPAPVSAAPVAGSGPAAAPADPLSLDELEVQAIRQAVEAAGGNISVAARRLGISRNTIYRKLRWSQRDSS